MIVIESLTKSFGSKLIIDDLSLSLPDEGVIAISGPSGSGKSTLLNIIAGLTPFESGSVTFTRDEKISIGFQSPTLFPSFNALENVLLASKKENEEEAKSLLKDLGIDEVNKYPHELSGGMASRVNIARALLREADVYLFDEPFSALDEESARKTLDVMLKRTKGKLLVMIVHDEEIIKDAASCLISFKESPIRNDVTTINKK
ncbi:MAG: ATP-binding cassette domain-containing protein [Bacilli bacterium]|nr:ATP-binding cassette domain-containing protein [Bacilli bacterium]